ncbi:PDZ domain-containing protein [Pendulispora brunnea]|uniref:PDZ domain-containing protein n=1 Tax=Pendulispora brunnea TaxID=2905690 RepID=A0ABZ2KUJ9_9BACT
MHTTQVFQVVQAYRIVVDPSRRQFEGEVQFEVPAPGSPVDVAVPTWVPGAYGFMRYGRDVFDVHAVETQTGTPLRIERRGFGGYRIEGAARSITVRWRASSCDTAWGELAGFIEGTWAVLLATRYLFVPAHVDAPCRVTYEFPPGYEVHLPRSEYPSFRALLDAPVVAWKSGKAREGAVTRITRRSKGKDLHFVFLGSALGFETEAPRFIDDVCALAERCHDVFGSYPFDAYTFIFGFDPRFHWGLEHADATMIGLGQDVFIDEEARYAALRVSAHELVHAWNVCRLRPSGLGEGELDLVAGSFTDGLWVSEGFTRYYEFLLLARAGKLTASRFFSNIARYHRALTDRPAYAHTVVRDSSRGTFINHNAYPGAHDSTLDYYDQGMLIAFDLDAALRRAAPGERSLDTEFRALYDAFAARPAGFTSEEAIAFWTSRTPAIEGFFAREVNAAAGLSTLERLRELGFETRTTTTFRIGAILKEGGNVYDVIDRGPAAQAGIAAGDELLSVDGFSFSTKALTWAIARGTEMTLGLRRGHVQRQAIVRPRSEERLTALVWHGDAAALERLRNWLGQPDLTYADGEVIPLAHYDNFHGTLEAI